MMRYLLTRPPPLTLLSLCSSSRVLHVHPPPLDCHARSSSVLALSLCTLPADILGEDERRVEAAVQSLRKLADRLHMPANVVTLPGDPRTVVAEYVLTSGADLLVVGSRGLSGATQALLGSVSSYLVSHASCPVVVYRAVSEGA